MVPCEVRAGIVGLLLCLPCSRGSAAIWEQTIALHPCAPSILWVEPAVPGAARPLGTLPAQGLAVSGHSCPAFPARLRLPSAAPSRPSQAGPCGGPWGLSPAMASGPLRAPWLELPLQVGLSCSPPSFGQCLSMLLVFHNLLACMDFFCAPYLF